MIYSLTIVTAWGSGGSTITPLVAWACVGAIVIISILAVRVYIKEKRSH